MSDWLTGRGIEPRGSEADTRAGLAAKEGARASAWLAKAAAEVEAARRRDHRQALALALRAMRAAMRDAPWHYAMLRGAWLRLRREARTGAL